MVDRIKSNSNEMKKTADKLQITAEDLRYISCDGKQCDPTICLRPKCKVFEYWRNRKEK